MADPKTSPIPEGDAKYLTINAVARRAKELARTRKPTIPYAEGQFDPTDVACEELEHGNLKVQSRNQVTGELEEFGQLGK